MIRESFRRRAATAVVLALGLVATGCGTNGPNEVSGTVMQGGQPVAGSVVFVDGANHEYASPIATDGKYQVRNLPAGQMKVLVRGAPRPVAAPKARAALAPPVGPGGAAPSAKYATAAGGLTCTVTGGTQAFDIDLK
jgi:hypothetical protein